jgi:hypothetical protein
MNQPPKPTESIYLPRPSAYPALLAFGLAAVIVGLFAWWPYSVIGAFIVLGALIGWLRANSEEIARMPRRQRTDTAAVPLWVSPPAE